MAWYIISTLIGATVFGAGILFERFLASGDMAEPECVEEQTEKLPEKENAILFGQWKNLLEYDGTRQEEIKYEEE